eukprot:CAMPEP_0185781388 /NCGR_PEP_ID=MMETSP1174-20130828/102230_1 /TAXON_ID=35687 /ORGANISM="Dictyocha speculum, Strain CCMP1381" /LENGTH=121 /DNA_ID=CAMNT_0028471349 /DNA_START=74 /DNA_END=436 /DNA_ORIENTATION=-
MVWSKGLSADLIGTTLHHELAHASDWFPTLVEGAAGGSLFGSLVDGYNHWDYLTGASTTWQRSEIPFAMDYLEYGDGALIDGDMKLIKGDTCKEWYNYHDGNISYYDGTNCSMTNENTTYR